VAARGPERRLVGIDSSHRGAHHHGAVGGAGNTPRRITQDEYDKKARELKERQSEIELGIEQHQKGEGDFRTTLESLISLASRAAENRAKAAASCLCLFEPSAQRKKARVCIVALRFDGQSAKLFELAGLPEYSSNRAF
jgi:hypothetical protein